MPPTADDIRQDIELKVVELLKKLVEEGSVTEERSQQIAKIVLDTLSPGMSLAQLYKAIPKLDDTAPELSPIILPYLRQYEEHITKKAEVDVQNLIKSGQYDAAADLAKKTISQEVELISYGAAKPK